MTDVVIVGAGPTGLTLANLLGAAGVATLLVEANDATVGEPRAVSIDDETLRTVQAMGLLDTVAPSIVAGYGSDYRSPRGRVFLTVKPAAQPYGHPRRNA
ncbi:FAD-dependent monooxygenase, partial [uncultured Sphingomonas sp.]|uniref:FAD-dependent monooxygenase n=1 Tax=uncultured Sphingomonas sp. TaxID=158754 RepID=UPI0035CB7B71